MLALLLLLVGPRPAADPGAPLRLSPAEWDFGTVGGTSGVLQQPVSIENATDRPVRISLLSTCSCLTVEPSQMRLKPGEVRSFLLRYDPSEDAGEVQKDLLLRTDLPGLEKALYLVRGRVEPAAGRAAGGSESGAPPEAGPPAAAWRLQYYHAPGCPSCRRFLDHTVPGLERELGIDLPVEALNILDPGVYERYRAALAGLGEGERALPALVVDRSVLQGSREIESRLPQLLRSAAGSSIQPGPPAGGTPGWRQAAARLSFRLAFLPVLAAGLLDGINPCAFTTLIFLLAALSLAGRGRREILFIGLFFSFAVLATYFLIGLGLFQALRLAGGFPLISRILRVVLVAVLFGLAGLSLYDFFQIQSGRRNRILLQLPGVLKRRIHASIRVRVGSATLISSSLALGFLVSVFELACTGQVYLPTLVYLVQTRREASAILYLLLYNLGFIAPLLVVFTITYLGTGSRPLTSFLQRSMGPVKLALVFLFVGLAFLTLVSTY
jgi:cytochrome c biogenesis protein CcdA